MGRDASAFPLAVIAQAVVLADDLISFDVAHAERNPAMETDIFGRHEAAIGNTIYHHPFIEQAAA